MRMSTLATVAAVVIIVAFALLATVGGPGGDETPPRLTIKSAAVYVGNYSEAVLEIEPLNGTIQVSAIEIGDFYVECLFNNVISQGGVYAVKLPNASVEPGRVLAGRLILRGNISYPFAASVKRGPAPEAKPLCGG
ncbi:hypothetical protein [Pyrobaculum calidifontis]|uniref:Uncharacterized protein n=1 Tax=Pyrobaculum calidifontis (strain DSM 21063 / JCM 11548 / VA1) TaxID=410359 RepID=A3MWF3_PYRCJ|nr:hypothetical protein [Pyrobaculum calidifontis]ABO08970.1 hypothetical protein Pcal_1552 [Pyrobaculum calidifontis JCM 11548]